MSFYIAPMRQEDIPEVSRVDHVCFTNPWPASAYRRELKNTTNNYYVVLWERNGNGSEHGGRNPLSGLLSFGRRGAPRPDDRVVGFAGMWVLFDEAHVTTIGVLPEYRGRGLGEALLVHLFDKVPEYNAEFVTLEVRVSNDSAQKLYEKYGFSQQGIRRRYYSDNGEDAYIMWSPSLKSAHYAERFAALRAALIERVGPELLNGGVPESDADGTETTHP